MQEEYNPTIAQMVADFEFQVIQPLLTKELNKMGVTPVLPQPQAPTALERIIVFQDGEPTILPTIEIENIGVPALRELNIFFTNWTNHISSKLTIVKIEEMLIKEQYSTNYSGVAVEVKENKITDKMIAHYANLEPSVHVINIALTTKKAVRMILEDRYNAYRRLLHSISREGTLRNNEQEYTYSSQNRSAYRKKDKSDWTKQGI